MKNVCKIQYFGCNSLNSTKFQKLNSEMKKAGKNTSKLIFSISVYVYFRNYPTFYCFWKPLPTLKHHHFQSISSRSSESKKTTLDSVGFCGSDELLFSILLPKLNLCRLKKWKKWGMNFPTKVAHKLLSKRKRVKSRVRW